MIKTEYSLTIRKPSADVLSYYEYVAQQGTDHEKTELAYLRSCDQALYDLYPTLPQPNNGLEVDGEYISFDDQGAFHEFEQHMVRLYDDRAKAVVNAGLTYCLANNIYIHRVVREVDENNQVYTQVEGFEDQDW
jgi:hypothetical protein